MFNLMEIQTTQTFKQFFQAETLNAEKNKACYQRYNATRLRAFHKQAMMKQQIYKNMLERLCGVDCIPEIQFQTSLINMEEVKEITMRNQLEKKQQNRCHCVSIKHLLASSKDCPVGLAIRKSKHLSLGIGLSKYE